MQVSIEEETKDPLRELEELLPSLKVAVERTRLGNELTSVCQSLDRLRPTIAGLKELIETLPLVLEDLDSEYREAILQQAGRLESFAEQLEKANSTKELDQVARELRVVETCEERISREIRQAWELTVEREFGTAAKLGRTLKAISKDPVLLEAAKHLTQAAHLMRNWRGRPARTDQEREQFSHCQMQRDLAYEAIQESGAKPEVVKFLEAVANGTANFGHVTAEVARWIESNGAQEHFSINLV